MIIKYKPDIVHYPVTSYWNLEKSLLFLSTAKLLGVKKVIGHLHGGAFKIFWSSFSRIRKIFAKRQLFKLDAFLVLSSYWEKFAIDTLGLNSNDVFIVNNPISSKFEMYFEYYKRNYIRKNCVKIISISGLTQRKGISDNIDALREISSNFKYYIVGSEIENDFIEKVRSKIDSYNYDKKVILTGTKFGQDKIKLITESDIYLLPSYIENFPLVIIEAACAGLPIITTPVGALPEFFTHMENIYFVEPGNIEEIKKAIRYMIDNSDERERLGKAARKVFIEKLSREKIMKQLEKVYENC